MSPACRLPNVEEPSDEPTSKRSLVTGWPGRTPFQGFDTRERNSRTAFTCRILDLI
jgi:hypothetical protein